MVLIGWNWRVVTRRVHVSWLIAWASLGIICGAVASQFISQSFTVSMSWLVLSLALIVWALWRQRIYVVLIIFLAAGIVGLWRGGGDLASLVPYKTIQGHTVTVNGTVSEDPEFDKTKNMLLRLSIIKIAGHDMPGKVWVSTKTTYKIKRGDIVTVTGKVTEGFGTFSAAFYRANITNVERPQPGDVAGQVRDWFADMVRRAIPDPEASLGIGYVVGQRNSLPPELDDALKTAGLTHIVVASGYNLTILVRLARRLFVKVSKYLSALAAGSMIVGFMAVTGLSPSMVRAGIVAGLSLLAWYYGRKFHPLVLLPLVAAITVLIDPSYVWGDLGWLLSFAAFAGVMILAPLLQRYFFGEKEPGVVRQILGETISAQIVTLPILLLSFGQFSNIALLANLAVLPLVPAAMLLTFLAGMGAWLVPGVVTMIGFPATAILKYMVEAVYNFANVPGAVSSISISLLAAVGIYMAIAAGCVYMWRKTRLDLREANLVE